MLEIAEDTVAMMMKHQEMSEGKDLREILFKWSLESVNYFLFGLRIGCFSSNPPPEALQFTKGDKQCLKLGE